MMAWHQVGKKPYTSMMTQYGWCDAIFAKRRIANITMLSIHYSDVIMGTMASQITSLTIVYSIVYSGVDQWKYQSSASLAFVRGIHRRPVNSLPSVVPPSHHNPGPRTGCSRAVLNKNRTSTHGARTGPVWRRTNFAYPYGVHRVLMHAL